MKKKLKLIKPKGEICNAVVLAVDFPKSLEPMTRRRDALRVRELELKRAKELNLMQVGERRSWYPEISKPVFDWKRTRKGRVFVDLKTLAIVVRDDEYTRWPTERIVPEAVGL